MTRRKFTSAFKTKVVLAVLKERESLSELAQKYEVHPQQIRTWKREFLKGAENVFSHGEKKSARTEAEEKEEKLLKIIGRQKVELDFLKKALS
ncbi:transposase [Rapidithrix thailandica]|uniref:Transposase n=1 Tax=Rapidithrix thailandica TaxID=413964 RepID=A0AAW9SC68_9BACT